ncbi:MAG: HAMP domain-containing histidine kinase, partial [Clostridia bacterium]|nr:HAMP domain-containing histidine kinase [Clostridia bacterium]
MNIYADTLVNDVKSEGAIDPDHVAPLTDSGVEVTHMGERDGNIYVYYPRNTIADYDFLSNVVSILNVENKESHSAEVKLSSGLTIFYTARKIDMGAADDYIVLSTSMSSVEDAVAVLRKQLFLVAVIVCFISLFLSYVVAERISRPIDNMSAMADRWAKGDDSVKFKGGSYTEIDELANALNKAKTEVNKTTKLQRDLMANVSHDLKTPLTMIKAYAEM